MSKIIIYNNSRLSDSDALDCVKNVINEGRISNDNKQYCYLSILRNDSDDIPDIAVSTDLNKNSDKFIISDY
jgi:hypothetical protein